MTSKAVSEADSPDPRTAAADASFRRFLRTGDPAAIADLFDLAAGDLHRTALHLVGDDATAHDLVQITFLVALERRTFNEGRPVLPWLGGILRNQATLVHRRRAQRLDRDRLRAEPSEDPSQRAVEHELAGEIEASLERLPDAYRPVVRLHVLHGLGAAAIAATLQRPGGTVRTQLVRGLEKLRALLPLGVAGVIAGMLPTTGLAAVRGAVLAKAGAGGAATLATAARPRFALLAVSAIAALAAGAWWLGSDDAASPVPATAVARADTTPGPSSALASVERAPVARPEPVPAAAEAEFELRGVVTGSVRGVDGQPVAGADVLAWPQEHTVMNGATFAPAPAASTRTADDGTFVLRARGTKCYVIARTGDAICEHGVLGELDGRDRVDGLQLRLQPLIEQRGRLLDADGRPVPDFAFGTYDGSETSERMRLDVPGFRRFALPRVQVRTDGAGEFAAIVAANESYLWEVQHPRHPMLRVSHRAVDGPVELRLTRGTTLGGVVWLANGAPAAGAKVTVADWPRRVAVCDATGHWTVDGTAMREQLWLSVVHEHAAIHCAPVPAASTSIETRLEAPRALAGRVVDSRGQPVADRELRLVGDRKLDTGFVHVGETTTWEYLLDKSRVRTGADGSFRVDNLYDGTFRIELTTATRDHVLLQQARSGSERLELRWIDVSARLVGKVVDAATGAPIEAGTICVMRSPDGGTSWNGQTTPFASPRGELAFGDVAPGVVRLSFAAPGYAQLELPERTLVSGEQRCDLVLYPLRDLLVEVRWGAAATDGSVRVRTTDGQRLMLWAGGPSYDRLTVVDGRARVERLPARPLVVTLVRGGEEDVELPVDLTKPRREPLVFDLDSAATAPAMRFSVIVRTCARGADTSRWAGRLAASSRVLRELELDKSLGMPDREVTLTFCNDAGAVLAKSTIKPGNDGTFESWTQYPGGKGHGTNSPLADVDVNLRTHAVTVTVDSEGRQPLTRRFLPHEVAGETAAFVLVLPAK